MSDILANGYMANPKVKPDLQVCFITSDYQHIYTSTQNITIGFSNHKLTPTIEQGYR